MIKAYNFLLTQHNSNNDSTGNRSSMSDRISWGRWSIIKGKKKPNLGLVFKNYASPRIQARRKNQNTMQGGSGSTWCWSWSSVCTPEKESTILAFVGGTKWIEYTQIKPTMERLKAKQISPLNQSAGEALFRKRDSWTRKMENWKEAQNWGRKNEDDVEWNWRKENFHLRLPVPHSLTWHWQPQKAGKGQNWLRLARTTKPI